MQNAKLIQQFQETVLALMTKGLTKVSVQKESKMSVGQFGAIMNKDPSNVVIYASTRAKMQDFNKKYVDVHTSFVREKKDPLKDHTPTEVKPIVFPAEDEHEDVVGVVLDEKATAQKKASTEEFLIMLSALCEDHKPPNIKISITIS